jgi:hypothetical protein
MERDILRYQGRLLTYIYMNLHAATVEALKGSDISISYSLKLNRYPLVLIKVKRKAIRLIKRAHITGVESAIPYCP